MKEIHIQKATLVSIDFNFQNIKLMNNYKCESTPYVHRKLMKSTWMHDKCYRFRKSNKFL